LRLSCECGQRDCRETVSLSRGALEAHRRTNRAVLAPGHTLGRADEAVTAHAVMAQSAGQLRRSQRVRSARVLAVDDSEIFLQVADSVLSGTTGLRLVGTAASGEEAIQLLPQLQPDLVLLDVHMPGIGGVETADIIRRESPRTVVVLVSAEPKGLEAAAESVGAVAIVDKVDLSSEMLDELWLKRGSHR
jgi:CheY-like chemotaxis protein